MSRQPASTPQVTTRFVAYPQFNDQATQHFAGMKHRIHSLPPDLFPTDNLPDRLAKSLRDHRVVHIKELLEAFEFFARVRRRVRRPTMVDLCAGHGLAGLIFALCEHAVTQVILIDERRPASFERIWSAFVSIAPWIESKVTYQVRSLSEPFTLPENAGVLLVHACGALTDDGLRRAAACQGPVAAMPCCYGKAEPAHIGSLSVPLGREVNIDVARSYRLRDDGYQVDWSAIPEAITPKNRVIVGWNRERT